MLSSTSHKKQVVILYSVYKGLGPSYKWSTLGYNLPKCTSFRGLLQAPCYSKEIVRKHWNEVHFWEEGKNKTARYNTCGKIYSKEGRKKSWWKPGSASRKQMWWVCIVEQQPKDQYELGHFTEDRHQTRHQEPWSVWSVSELLTLGKSFVTSVFPFPSLKLKQNVL